MPDAVWEDFEMEDDYSQAQVTPGKVLAEAKVGRARVDRKTRADLARAMSESRTTRAGGRRVGRTRSGATAAVRRADAAAASGEGVCAPGAPRPEGPRPSFMEGTLPRRGSRDGRPHFRSRSEGGAIELFR